MTYMVAVYGSYLFAFGKTSTMQLSQNNLSLKPFDKRLIEA